MTDAETSPIPPTPRPLRTGETSGARSASVPSALSPHPAASLSPVRVEVSAVRRDETLTLTFVVTGELGRVAWPPPAAPGRADELWRTTCFEAFVRPDDPDGPDCPDCYFEVNLSPSGRWAAYAFDGYRTAMRDLALGRAPEIAIRRTADAAEVTAAIDLTDALPAGTPWRLGLSAVIEDAEGRIAYLALAHAPDRPDFHHPASFALQLTDAA